MLNGLRKFVSYLIVITLFCVSDSGHLIHEFADHHDTADCRSAADGIGIPHVHCEALQSSLPAFTQSFAFFFTDFSSCTSQIIALHEFTALFHSPRTLSDRAPPVLA